MKKKKERVIILIDGSNFYHSTREILKPEERINYQKLVNELIGNRELVNACYYIAPLDIKIDSKKYYKHQEFLNVLTKIPKFKVVLCSLKKIKVDDGSFIYLVKGDDVKLSNTLLIGAFDNLYDIAIVVSGDEDFIDSINIVRKRFKKKVENAYFRSSSSYKLRKACNSSININKIISKIIDRKNNKSSSATQR